MERTEAAPPEASWTVAHSERLYRIAGWGHPYFRAGRNGHLHVWPRPDADHGIDLFALVEELGARGLRLPLLVRFPEILEHRLATLHGAFERAMREYGYQGRYQGVFPVKVNQQRHLVEDVVRVGRRWGYGLEAGSKPELLLALASMEGGEGLLVCNGYKDRAFVETALVARHCGHEVIVVVERLEELGLVLEAARRVGVEPLLGLRAKLSSKGIGRWSGSAGDRAKFGLTAPQIAAALEQLRQADMLHALRLLHFHLGSQVSSILPIKNALREAAHLYVELRRAGAPMGYFDVGGGLAVDYDGSRSDFSASRNYDLQEYAYDVVYAIQDACERAGLEHPVVVTESGRAVAAHQSVLLFEVLGADEVAVEPPEAPAETAHAVLHELYETWRATTPKNVQEAWHDATVARDEARTLFRFGYLGLETLAEAESLFWACCRRIAEATEELERIPEELRGLHEQLASIYYANWSIFQSAPDVWALGQLFPIVPIHRLEERPERRARIADLTCDSDGMVERFIGAEQVERALPVHALRPGEPYVLGMFLGGAYQEILGDLHNLFGDTDAAHVRLTDRGYEVEQVIRGETTGDVLRYVQYEPAHMVERVRRRAERALARGELSLAQVQLLVGHVERGLRGSTYLERD